MKGDSIFVFFDFLYLHTLCTFATYSSVLSLTSLVDLVVADYPTFIKRFELTYCFLSHFSGFRLFFKTHAFAVIFSISMFFSSANWLEREAWDLYGLRFLFNSDLRRILTDYGFKGHPLRKDFPLLGYVEVRYDDSFSAVLTEQVEFAQAFRFFTFGNP